MLGSLVQELSTQALHRFKTFAESKQLPRKREDRKEAKQNPPNVTRNHSVTYIQNNYYINNVNVLLQQRFIHD